MIFSDRGAWHGYSFDGAGGEGLEWLRRVVRAIEAEDLHCASVFCSQGRHRSVSAALILRSRYYPNAEFVPLNMR